MLCSVFGVWHSLTQLSSSHQIDCAFLFCSFVCLFWQTRKKQSNWNSSQKQAKAIQATIIIEVKMLDENKYIRRDKINNKIRRSETLFSANNNNNIKKSYWWSVRTEWMFNIMIKTTTLLCVPCSKFQVFNHHPFIGYSGVCRLPLFGFWVLAKSIIYGT